MNSSSSIDSSFKTGLLLSAMASTVAGVAAATMVYRDYQARIHRRERCSRIQAEIRSPATGDLPSILVHFRNFQLDFGATVGEANRKRTTKYYELAREAHRYDLVPAVRSYPRLRNLREEEMKRIFRYKGQNKSHRTVLVMLDTVTSSLLGRARKDILRPLKYSHDISTATAWIPKASMLPEEDLHVTIAIPWWWHGIRDGNEQLSQELVNRFRQALVLEFHHAFQLELERIVLLGGKALVALWRTVGEREAPGEFVIFDRHGEGLDPLVKLRRDIVRCFTCTDDDEANRFRQQPLTYSSRFFDGNNHAATELPLTVLGRRNTIECKTPGLGDHDGFIHTTLARLPIDCLSMNDVELEPIHRLCREATATCCGHRMVVSRFRFLETTGTGGESNPCVAPIFDEYVEAPERVEVGINGELQRTMDLHTAKIIGRRGTIGNLPPSHSPKPSMDTLFLDPKLVTADLLA